MKVEKLSIPQTCGIHGIDMSRLYIYIDVDSSLTPVEEYAQQKVHEINGSYSWWGSLIYDILTATD